MTFGNTTLFNGPTLYGIGDYELLSFVTTATGNSETLSFTSQYTLDGQGIGAVIDDVSVDPVVPEPGTLVMLGTGIVGDAAAIRRKLRV